MLSIYGLPNEIISQIFAHSCDLEDTAQNYTLYGSISCKTRHPKVGTLNLMAVCRWWRNIAMAQSNSHLSVAEVKFGEPRDDISKIVADVRNVLQTSYGCDLVIDIVPYFLSSRMGLSAAQYEVQMCLVLHLLTMLGDYHRQWRIISLDRSFLPIASKFASIVDRLKFFPRLLELKLSCFPQSFTHTTTTPSTMATTNGKRAYETTFKPLRLPSSGFASLIKIGMFGIDDLPQIATIPTQTQILELSPNLNKTFQWLDVLRLVRQTPCLRILKAIVNSGPAFGNQQSTVFHTTHLPQLQELVALHSPGFHKFFHHSIDHSVLKILSLSFDDYYGTGEEGEVTFKLVDLPMLNKLELLCSDQHVNMLQFMLHTRMPRLEHLSIVSHYHHIPAFDQDLKKTTPSNPRDGLKPKPISLTLSCYKSTFNKLLSMINCTHVKTFDYQNRESWNLVPQPPLGGHGLPQEPVTERINFPSLTNIVLTGAPCLLQTSSAATLVATRHFLASVDAPILKTVEFGDYDVFRDDTGANFRALSDTWEECGSGVPPLRSLRVCLPIYAPVPDFIASEPRNHLLLLIPEAFYTIAASQYDLVRCFYCNPALENGLLSSVECTAFQRLGVTVEEPEKHHRPSYKSSIIQRIEPLLDTVVESWRMYAGLDLEWRQTAMPEAWLTFEITRIESCRS